MSIGRLPLRPHRQTLIVRRRRRFQRLPLPGPNLRRSLGQKGQNAIMMDILAIDS